MNLWFHNQSDIDSISTSSSTSSTSSGSSPSNSSGVGVGVGSSGGISLTSATYLATEGVSISLSVGLHHQLSTSLVLAQY